MAAMPSLGVTFDSALARKTVKRRYALRHLDARAGEDDAGEDGSVVEQMKRGHQRSDAVSVREAR